MTTCETTAAIPTRETFAHLVDAYHDGYRWADVTFQRTEVIAAEWEAHLGRKLTREESAPLSALEDLSSDAKWAAINALLSAITEAGYQAIRLGGAIYYAPDKTDPASNHPLQSVAADRFLDLDAE